MHYQSINPATEEKIQTYPDLLWEKAIPRLEKAVLTSQSWRKKALGERSRLLIKLAHHLKNEKGRLSPLITQEMGKPITQAEAEIEKCAWTAEHYAEKAGDYLRELPVPTEAKKSYVRYDPLGVVLGIMPWNFPFWQVFRFSIPAITAGNAVLLKPAPNVPACSLMIEKIFKDVGFPEDLFQNLFFLRDTTAQLIASDYVQAVSLTGSSRAGSEIAATAGRALKKTVMELGGSDPFIVLDDADLEKAIPAAVTARTGNSGQSCNAGKRFIVTQKVFSKFEEGFVNAMGNLKVGDPSDRSVEIGPIAREDLLKHLIEQVEKSKEQGAKVLVGGERIKRKGFFYAPTVLKDVKPGMTAFEEELFGPVASLIVAKDEEEAIDLANRSSYGLGASLWTQDLKRAEEIVPRLEAGVVYVNNIVRSDPRLPFGGIKQSGYGRELGPFGLHEFVNIKTVWVA